MRNKKKKLKSIHYNKKNQQKGLNFNNKRFWARDFENVFLNIVCHNITIVLNNDLVSWFGILKSWNFMVKWIDCSRQRNSGSILRKFMNKIRPCWILYASFTENMKHVFIVEVLSEKNISFPNSNVKYHIANENWLLILEYCYTGFCISEHLDVFNLLGN